jgi:hypothetical protein
VRLLTPAELSEGLVRAFVVEVLPKPITTLLLSLEGRLRWPRGLGFEGAMHALVGAVLFWVSRHQWRRRLDRRRRDAELVRREDDDDFHPGDAGVGGEGEEPLDAGIELESNSAMGVEGMRKEKLLFIKP